MANTANLVILHNTNQEFKKEVFSADNDSVHIMPGKKQPVDKKFLWNLPKGVVEYRDTEIVFGKVTDPNDEQKVKEKDVANKNGNTKNVEDARQTVSTTSK